MLTLKFQVAQWLGSKTMNSTLERAGSAFLVATAIGCGGMSLDESGSLGQLSLSLSAVSEKEEHYLLSNASFRYFGASRGTFSVPEGEASFRSILPVGDYGIQLLDGWRLERETAHGLVPISAAMASDNPAPFTIAPAQVAPVAFAFKTGAGLVSSEGVLDLRVAVDDSEDDSAGNGCPHEFCGPITFDFEEQAAATVISDQYADYMTFSTPAPPPVVVHVVPDPAGHAVCADPAGTTQCHSEMDIDFRRPVEGLSLSLVRSSTTVITHSLGTTSRTVLSNSVQSFADLHEITRVEFTPISPLGSLNALTFTVIARAD
jgi:hypothetical protein